MHKRDIFNLKKSVLAILFGFLTIFIISTILKPGSFMILVKSVFFEPFSSTNIFKLLLLSSVLIIVSLAMSVSFRASLFNIGIPGQMLAGAIIPSMIVSTVAKEGWFPGSWTVFILIGLISGALVGGLAGYLKSRFNIHEVIATIMLNWIIFYTGKAIFSKEPFKNTGYPGSKIWHTSLRINVFICIAIAIILIFVIWYLFNKTKFGYKITLVGNQPSVLNYAGYSKTKIQTLTLAISGGLAGMAGVLYYGTYTTQYIIPLFNTLDTIGFNAIIVALVAFKNPILIGPIALIFAIVQTGGYIASVGIHFAGELMALAFGLMMYIIAVTDNWNYKKKKPQRKGN